MRASRLLSIQMLLETRGRMSAVSLADTLDVSVRTLHRDIDALSAAGVPVYAERGRAGGFQLLPGWKTSLTGLTPAEAQAVFLGGLGGVGGPAAALGLGGEVEGARLKLLTALPAAWRDDAQRVGMRLHLDPVDWYREADATPCLPVVAAAVWSGTRITMHYESWTRRKRRTVDPLGLVLKAGIWYLVAAEGGEPRTYRVSNIREAKPAEGAVRRPRGFDLAKHWRASVDRFEASLVTGEATVLATPEGLKGLRELGRAQAAALADAPKPTRPSGRVRVRIPIESVAHAARQMLRFGAEVEVLQPPALRREVAQRIEEARRLYGKWA